MEKGYEGTICLLAEIPEQESLEAIMMGIYASGVAMFPKAAPLSPLWKQWIYAIKQLVWVIGLLVNDLTVSDHIC